jgi:(E)-4-hydroxy-3-methylbut-2-enyl-diphosphate synthase
VIADLSHKGEVSRQDLKQIGYTYNEPTDKWFTSDTAADFVFLGNSKVDFMLPGGLKGIYPFEIWEHSTDKLHAFPLFNAASFFSHKVASSTLNFLQISCEELSNEILSALRALKNWVILLQPLSEHAVADLNNAFIRLKSEEIQLPVVVHTFTEEKDPVTRMLHNAIICGVPFINGFGDGVMISGEAGSEKEINDTSFGILQAARARVTKTEYISCPSCGRTLFDLQETTAMIRNSTDHLKGIKIAIMGCIVNGPGEMADADYGYVGSGPGKINLYRGKEVVKKGVNKETAVNELIQLIREDGLWVEQQSLA